MFIPKTYGGRPSRAGDARTSTFVKTNHSGDVPHFVYHGFVEDADSDVSLDGHAILARDPMNGKSSLFMTSFNIVNGIVGAGMISLPYVIKQQGFIPGIIGLIVVAIITYFTMILQIEVGRTAGAFSYETVCELAFGKRGFYILVFFMFVNAFGTCVAYACLIQMVIPPLVQPWLLEIVPDNARVYVTPDAILNVLAIFILFPLSLYRNLAKFERMSCLSIIVLVTLITVLSINFCDLGEFAAIHTEPFDDMIFAVGDEYFQGLGTLAFAFSCQQYSFHAFETLDDPTETRWSTVTFLSLMSSCIMGLIFGAVGYLSYGDDTEANILDNLSSKSGYGDMARLAVGAKMFLTFPLDFFVIRYCFQRMISRIFCGDIEWDAENPYTMGNDKRGRPMFTPIITRDNIRGKGKHSKDFTKCAHFSLTLVLFASVMACAYFAMNAGGKTKGLALVLQLSGGVGAIFIGFVFPTACYLKLGIVRIRMPNCWDSFYYIFAWIVMLFGIFAGFSTTSMTLYDAFK